VTQSVDYAPLDPILEIWAARHDVKWIRKDRDWDVRSLWWQLAHPESVQLWLDVPSNNQVTIHVCHNTTRGGQEHTEVTTNLGDLASVLDERFETAQRLHQKLTKKCSK
jgi:hypothetical protein